MSVLVQYKTWWGLHLLSFSSGEIREGVFFKGEAAAVAAEVINGLLVHETASRWFTRIDLHSAGWVSCFMATDRVKELYDH